MGEISIKKRVEEWKSRFSILKDWDIRIGSGNIGGQISTNPDLPSAIFHPWPEGSEEPDDFYFHEFIHLVLRAYSRIPEADNFDAEETLVREICSAYRAYRLRSAISVLEEYYAKHGMEVKDVIWSVWARGKQSGREEALNILRDADRS